MEMFISDHGKMIKLMVLVYTHTKMVLDMKESGKMTNSMERVLKLGPTKHLTKDFMLREKSTGLVCLHGRTAVLTKAPLSITISKGMVATDGLMEEFTKAAGKITRCMEVAFLLGLMDAHMKALTSTTKKKDKALLLGPTIESMLGHG